MYHREAHSARNERNRTSAPFRCGQPCTPPQTDLSMSERYTNRTYNRQPSPMGRFQRPSNGGVPKGLSFGRAREERPASSVSDQPRERVPLQKPVQDSHRSRLQLSSVNESRSRSVVVKQPTLALECAIQRPNSAFHPRKSRTTEQSSTPTSLSESPRYEEKLFHAVKDVLSRAVIEKGKIDENNIGKILQDMQIRLKGEDNEEEDDLRSEINVEEKRSTTAVNNNKSSENILVRKSRPPAGIVRRELKRPSNNRINGEYKRVYNRDPSVTQTRKESNPVFYGERERVVYIDLPDSDYSNFNSMVKQEKERMKKAFQKKAEEPPVEEVPAPKCHTTCEDYFKEEGVGDHHVKRSPSFDFWKTTEEAKLQSYIESLIRNMNDQVNGKQTPQEGSSSSVGDQNTTLCKSFCVCKVCVSQAAHPKQQSRQQEEPSPTQRGDVKEQDSRLKSRARSGTKIASSMSRTREPRVAREESNVNFKVLKRNRNFQPESNMNITPRCIMAAPRQLEQEEETSECYAIVPAEEAAEELYLKRRISQLPVKKRMNISRL